jgi:hypothetical protein
VLALLSLVLPVLLAFWDVGLNGQWTSYSLGSVLFHVPVLLAAAIGIAYALERPADVPRFLAAGLLVSIVIDVTEAALGIGILGNLHFVRVAGALKWAGPLWLSLALATYAGRFVDPGPRRLGAVLCCVLFIAVPLGSVVRDRELWHPAYVPEAGAGSGSARHGAGEEDVFYKQPALLAQELDSVRPGRKGLTEVFFVGMAGYGMQDVFQREVESVARIFRERFGAEGHTVRHINNATTLLETPIASGTALRAALKRVAEQMDKDEDVLVLYMTSHGSEDHRFSLMLWPLTFHEMDPPALRRLLDESGIRNRVVIMSACYSGGFVKPLENPDTLVITASAADRNSFGCSNEAEWTYFGKAYFDEALRTTHSFTRAFEIARPVIAEREKREKFDPSQPQMSVGANIASKLDALATRLDRAALSVERPRAPEATSSDPPTKARSSD